MRGNQLTYVALIVAIAGVLAFGQVFAQQRPQVAIPEDQAHATAVAAFPGTVVETEIDRYSGHIAYEFKIRPEGGGSATDVHVDGNTGVVLGVGNDNEPDSDNGRLGRQSGSPLLAGGPAAAPVQARAQAGAVFQEDFDLANRNLSDAGEGRYFVLQPGFQTVLSDGRSQLTITVLNETKDVGGVLTRVVEERLETAGLPDEIAMNYFAIDVNTGDAFYFGEDVDVFERGVLTGHPGTWLAIDGNSAGMIMPGTPVVGMAYYQEIAPDVAMDRAEVLSTSETCPTPAGDFADCLVTRETSAIETVNEVKQFAPGIGLIQDGQLRLIRYGYVDPGR